MLIAGIRWSRIVLLSMVAVLFGCIELEQQIRVHEDGSMSLKGTIRIDPQYEALVLPQMKQEMPKKAPPGVRLDFSQRIDGKAAVLYEADGEAAAAMLKEEDGSTSVTITVSDGGFMKKRYEYREVVRRVPEIPFPNRLTIILPGSIESVTAGKKTADDTVEFDQTHAKRGDVFAATSAAYAFSLGSDGAAAADVANPGMAAWLMPASIASLCAGVLLLLAGWFRSRQVGRAGGSTLLVKAPPPDARVTDKAEELASVFCTECGASNSEGRKFCSRCGHALE
jgi:zinc-ribbon domain